MILLELGRGVQDGLEKRQSNKTLGIVLRPDKRLDLGNICFVLLRSGGSRCCLGFILGVHLFEFLQMMDTYLGLLSDTVQMRHCIL